MYGEFHSDVGRKLKNSPFCVFGRKTHLFETVNRKRNFELMLDSFNSGNQALTAKKLFFDLWFYQPDEWADLKSTFNPRTFLVMFECF